VPAHPRHGPRAPSGSEWLSAEYAVGVRGCARALLSWLGRRASSTERASPVHPLGHPLPWSSTSPCRPRSTRSDGTARHGGESCRLVNRSPAVPACYIAIVRYSTYKELHPGERGRSMRHTNDRVVGPERV
jgi:hypothetical protein